MTNREMTSQEAREDWAALVAAAEHRGETTIITRYGKPVAVVGPTDLLRQEDTMTMNRGGIDDTAAANLADTTMKMLRAHGVDITLIDANDDGTFVLTAGSTRVVFGPDADGGWDWTGYDIDADEQVAQDWAADGAAMAAVLKGWS